MSCNRYAARTMAVCAAVELLASGCASTATPSGDATTTTTTAKVSTVSQVAAEDEMFTDRDRDASYDESAVAVTLKDNASACKDKGVSVSGNVVTITKAGTYRLSGTLTNGRVVVDADKSDKIQLVLDGVTINCDTSAALYVKQADKVFVTLASGSRNTLSNKKDFVAVDDNNIDAVIFSKEDLTLNGAGALTVQAAYGHGIVSKDDLVVTGGTIAVTAARHALAGKDSVRIADGSLTLTAGKDGIHAENADDTTRGFVYIAGGTVTVTCDGDGVDAGATAQIKNGILTITAGGGSANATQKKEEMFGPGGWNQSSSTTTDEESTSAKGIKSAGDLTISGGSITVDAADDALHSNANATISGGSFTLATGDDGLHADNNTAISGGTITISQSYEGIEGKTIAISGGNITLTASDDGLNAAGGNDQSGFGGGMRPDTFSSGDSDCSITISGGKIIINADGDGIDSNGNLYVTGGETYVSGPTNGGNGALDYDGEATITGGIVVAAGSTGMAQNFSDSSTQGAMLVNVSSNSATGEVVLKDSSGKTLVSYTPQKTYGCVVVSCPEVKSGSTYTLTAGGQTTTVEMTSVIYGSGSSMGGGMGGPGGNRGGGPGGMGGPGGGQ